MKPSTQHPWRSKTNLAVFNEAARNAPAAIPDWFNPGFDKVPDIRFNSPETLKCWTHLDKESQQQLNEMLRLLYQVNPEMFKSNQVQLIGSYLQSKGNIKFLNNPSLAGAVDEINAYHRECINTMCKMKHAMAIYERKRFYAWRLYYAYTMCIMLGNDVPENMEWAKKVEKNTIQLMPGIEIPLDFDPKTMLQYRPDMENIGKYIFGPCEFKDAEIQSISNL